MAVSITTDTNTVKVTSTSTNKVTVVDNTNNTSVSVSQPTTRVIKVATAGPQGPAGAEGSTFPYSGSAVITGSLSQGIDTIASGGYSHAEGSSTISRGYGSHAEGFNTTSTGSWSHTEGVSTMAFGVGSHAEGFVTVALGDYQHVQGAYNITSSAKTAFIIGNGTSNSTRSNLVFASGSQFQITGSLIVSGSSTFTGNQIVTGSTRGSVTALSIASNTASMDLSVGNFFTLQLVAGTNTYINPSSILPGQTSILTVSTVGSATVSWPSFIKHPSGSAYIPTTTTGIVIVTLASTDSSTLYVVNVKNMI